MWPVTVIIEVANRKKLKKLVRRFPRGTEFKVLQPVDVDDDGVLGKASKKSLRVLQPVDDDDDDVDVDGVLGKASKKSPRVLQPVVDDDDDVDVDSVLGKASKKSPSNKKVKIK